MWTGIREIREHCIERENFAINYTVTMHDFRTQQLTTQMVIYSCHFWGAMHCFLAV